MVSGRLFDQFVFPFRVSIEMGKNFEICASLKETFEADPNRLWSESQINGLITEKNAKMLLSGISKGK